MVRLRLSDSFLERTGKRNLVGTINHVEDQVIKIESKDKMIFEVSFNEIVKGKLEIDWNAELEKDSGFQR